MVLPAIISLFNIFWTAENFYNFYPLLKGRNKENEIEDYLKELDEEELPKVSVLLPAYKEEETLEKCIETLYKADYPPDKLEVFVLVERDDPRTKEIAKKLEREKYTEKNGYNFRYIEIADTIEPKGKPRALKQGLRHTTGEIVGVIDAEDLIDPRLFKEVVHYIKAKGYDAVQGILDMANDNDGWKNMQFRGEYGYWFRRYLPALARAGFPVPLGGTTNFIKKDVLKKVNGWDPYNLTEDFDLGLRLFCRGKKTTTTKGVTKREKYGIFTEKYIDIISSVTREESPITWKRWLRQRTRWQRGKIQTLKKILKKPPEELGKKFHSFMSCLSPHLGPINLLGICLSLYAYAFVELPLPILALTYVNLSSILCYMYMQAKGYLDATKEEKIKYRKLKALTIAATLPVYWFMQWVADLRAIKQEYIDKKIFWEKTKHEGRHFRKTK
jgi:cellulose synthase/poly-beta-1,6-N-acetylglucosamine synthase-like glycosyltransferase